MRNPSPKSDEEDYTPFEYPIVEQLFLERPRTTRTVNLFDALLQRKSVRQFSLLSLDQLGELLWYSAHVKGIFRQENGYVLSHRPAPSAGGRHPIDLIVSSPVLGVSELFVYDPFEHALSMLRLDKHDIIGLHKHTQSILHAPHATTIWFIAHSSRTSVKYENPESLIWRDAGALIYNIQIVATGLKLNCCPLGTLGEPNISELFKRQDKVWSAGGLVIGSPDTDC